MIKTITLNKAQADFATLMELAINKHSQFRIASEQGGVILISEEDYDNLLETLELLSRPSLL
ncbi:MAG: type II toxin-antitoxin system Phd/YefM family antitoxin [Anaerolineales bacterium]|nr:type II toxin-antitoxin system Phd/YefM family antitoxin [Anaerolineales bacterium]MCB9432146.1 type II toxin-antitoxin system Phd/YefM family antitoxin [Ardenticatenaceae bacterium]